MVPTRSFVVAAKGKSMPTFFIVPLSPHHHYHSRVLGGPRAPPSRAKAMLINLLPDFFALLDSSDPAAAYRRYFAAHQRLLEAYWLNYVIEPVGPHFEDIVRTTLGAE